MLLFFLLIFIFCGVCLSNSVFTVHLPSPRRLAQSPEDWSSRSIYQLLTDRFATTDEYFSPGKSYNLSSYCGGNYKGIVRHLDYIQGMGFDAIWISPIPTNAPNGYHGYWATDFFSLNEHFGTRQDLINLVNEAHDRGMLVMLDVVANHAGPTEKAGDYTGYTFNDSSQYHPQHTINYDDQNSVEQGWVADNLPDINTEDQTVVDTLCEIVASWCTTFGFDGIRIDTMKHVRKDFWPRYIASASVFATGEVYHGDQRYVGPYQHLSHSVLNYPLYYPVTEVFAQGVDCYRLRQQLVANREAFRDVRQLTNFVDNHDVPRFLHINHDVVLFKNALTFILLCEGIPVVYYGSEQGFHGGHDPNNREPLWTSQFDTSGELYQFIQLINGRVRKRQGKNVTMDVHVDKHTYGFMHGRALVIVNNYGSGSNAFVELHVPDDYSCGTVLVDVVSRRTVVVNGHGRVAFHLQNGNPVVLLPFHEIKNL